MGTLEFIGGDLFANGKNVSEDGTESGSNENGHWTKFPDGTLICRYRSLVQSETPTSRAGIFSGTNQSFVFPVEFMNGEISLSSASVNLGGFFWSINNTPIKTGVTMYPLSTAASGKGFMGYIATGRWK